MTDDTSPVEEEPVYEPADDDVGEDDPHFVSDTTAMAEEIARYSSVPSGDFMTLGDYMATPPGEDDPKVTAEPPVED